MLRVLTLTAFLAWAAPAAAVSDCPGAQPAKTLLSGQGVLESVIGGPDGRLYYTDTSKKALMRLDAPGAQPKVVADGIESPGGLLLGLDGTSILVGYGDGFQQGIEGNLVGRAGIIRVDLASGKKTTIVTGTSMSNGLARDPAGVIYASDDAGTGIDRIVGTAVQPRWSTIVSSNGLAVSPDGRYLYANQTFQPAAIRRIDLTNPADVQAYATPGPEDIAAGLDGLTIDQDGRLFAATNGISGQVWRIATDRSICALARNVSLASAVAFGGGGAFPVTSLYAVGFAGELVEIPGVRAAPPVTHAPYLTVRVHPRLVRARHRTRLAVVVRRTSRPEPRARVRVGPHTARTGVRGRAYVVVRPWRRGVLRVRVRAAGVKPVTVRVPVLRARRGPRPQALSG